MQQSPNNDTIYSIAIINARQGFTLDAPDVGDRFLSIQIMAEDHVTRFYLYGDGQYTFSAEDLEIELLAVGIRTGTDATAADVRVVTEELQPQIAISGAAPEDDLPTIDAEVLEGCAPPFWRSIPSCRRRSVRCRSGSPMSRIGSISPLS